jgi:mannosyltransferase
MKHKNRFWLLVALLLAFALRVYALDVQSLWNDEGTSVALASLSIEAIINSAARDIHPPLYYLLLHFWLPFAGTTEYAVRFLSVIAGVVIVALVFRIAYSVFDERVATLATFLTALSPFQVYYSQEARMYIWVTLWAAVSVWAFVKLKVKSSKFKVETAEVSGQRSVVSGQKSEVGMWVVYVVATLAALYTQYVGAFIVLAENLAFGVWLFFAIRNSQFTIRNLQSAIRTLAPWLIGQLIIGSLFLPWYLFAGGQLASWPSISEPLDLPTLVWRVLNVFSIGLTLDGNLATITSILLGGLFLLGCWRPTVPLSHCFTVPLSHCPTVPLSHRPTVPLLLWTLVPVAAMYIVSLTRPAYNPKFLLLATPAFYILAARGLSFVLRRSSFVLRRSSFILCSLLILAGSALSLLNYYTDPRYARDDYRTILQFIDAHERAGDGILVNAPGQIDVVRYYWRGNQQLFLLPRMRPPDPIATRADVDEMLDKTERLFAIYWATDQSDPARVVETRLAERAFKARDEWHGNVRLVLYGIAPRSRSVPQPLDVRFGDAMTLTSYQLDARRARVGDVLTLTLHWRVEQMPNARYKIFVHLLDASGRVVAQRDGEPLADLRPTTTWRAGETLADNYGVFIEPDTPPGDYRVEIGVYRADDGARVPVGESDHLILGTVQVK